MLWCYPPVSAGQRSGDWVTSGPVCLYRCHLVESQCSLFGRSCAWTASRLGDQDDVGGLEEWYVYDAERNLNTLEDHLRDLLGSFAAAESKAIESCIQSSSEAAAQNSYLWKSGKRGQEALAGFAAVSCVVAWLTSG